MIVCAGGVLPSGFLMDMGVTIERHFGRDKAVEVIEECGRAAANPRPRNSRP